ESVPTARNIGGEKGRWGVGEANGEMRAGRGTRRRGRSRKSAAREANAAQRAGGCAASAQRRSDGYPEAGLRGRWGAGEGARPTARSGQAEEADDAEQKGKGRQAKRARRNGRPRRRGKADAADAHD